MEALVAIGLVILALAGIGVYHFAREKSHEATVKALQKQLEHRATELEEAT